MPGLDCVRSILLSVSLKHDSEYGQEKRQPFDSETRTEGNLSLKMFDSQPLADTNGVLTFMMNLSFQTKAGRKISGNQKKSNVCVMKTHFRSIPLPIPTQMVSMYPLLNV